MTEESNPPIGVPVSDPKRTRPRKVPRRDASKTFTVQKLPSRSRRKPEPTDLTSDQSDSPANLATLTEAESRARLNALEDARSREPEELREAAEKARIAAEQETARIAQELKVAREQRDQERDRLAALERKAEDAEQLSRNLKAEIANLQAKLAHVHGLLTQNAAELEHERENARNLKAALSTKAIAARDDAAEHDEMAVRLEKAENALFELRSRAWWRWWSRK